MMAKTSFSGVTLHVADLERSKAFYLRIPGTALVHERPGRFALIQIGRGHISLLAMNQQGFHIEIGTDDLDELLTQLQMAGIEQAGPQPAQWGERGLITQDPDGNFVEFDDHWEPDSTAAGRAGG